MAINKSELITTVHNLFVGRLCSASAFTLVWYDWALVFPKEYETMYKGRWSLPKALLLYIRAITPLCLTFTAVASSDFRPALSDLVWIYMQSFGMLTCLFAANGLLSLRLIALYRRKRLLVWFIISFYLSSYITTLGLLTHSMTVFHGTIHYSEVVKSCQATAHSRTMAAVFYAPAAFETFVFGMTAYSAMKDARIITGNSAPFLIVLYRDELICFLVMIGLRVWNCWIYITQPVSSYAMGTPFMWAANAVLTIRVYLNLVWLAKKPLITVSDYPNHGRAHEAGPSINFRMPVDNPTYRSDKRYTVGLGNELEMAHTFSRSHHENEGEGGWT